MREVTVHKAELVKALTKNRAEHKKIFKEACDGYKKRTEEILEEHLKRVRNGKMERISVSLPVPTEHTHEYDRALKMLEMSVPDQITIDESRFAELVMDDWGWQREFLTSSSMYSVQAANKLK